jgi:Fic family protein
VVLSFQDLKAAVDDRIISDSTLIPAYDEIRHHRAAIVLVREWAHKKKLSLTLDTLKKLYLALTPDQVGKPSVYRKDNPLHRMYFHEIVPPDKISYKLRKLVDWLASVGAERTVPVRRAARAHLRLMQIFPWTRNSGRVARLLMNLILLHEGYLPAILHGIERQRYYDSLRLPPGASDEDDDLDQLVPLLGEALAQALEAGRRYLDEAERAGRARVA